MEFINRQGKKYVISQTRNDSPGHITNRVSIYQRSADYSTDKLLLLNKWLFNKNHLFNLTNYGSNVMNKSKYKSPFFYI